MGLKKVLLVICLIIYVAFSISTISASDISENITATDADAIATAEHVQEDIINSNENYPEETLSASHTVNGNTFADIQNAVNNAKSGDTINLHGTYIGTGTHIKIDKPLTIEGNGATLDAKGLSKIFEITGTNVKVNNIQFTNGKSSCAGAIDWWHGDYGENRDANGLLTNCKFTNCQAEYRGGAVYVCDNSVTIYGCEFSNNEAYAGGAVFISGNNCIIDSCNFHGNYVIYQPSVVVRGGTICLEGQNIIINNCIITGNAVNMGLYKVNGYYIDEPTDKWGAGIKIINDVEVSNIRISNTKFDNKFTWYKFYTEAPDTLYKYESASNILSDSRYYLAKDTCSFSSKQYGGIGISTDYNDIKLINTAISVPTIKYTAGSSVKIVASVKANGANVNQGTVLFSVDGKYYNVNVINGKSTLNLKLDGNKKNINCFARYIPSFNSNVHYSHSSTSFKIVLESGSKTVGKTTLVLKKVTVKRSAKKLTIKATLKIKGKSAKGKTIKFKFNKKTYKAKTNVKGVAKITLKKSALKKLKKGKRVTYSATYGKVTVKQTVKVK